jgi:hypothetical protein
MMGYLVRIETMFEETPPIQQPMRFGNKAFKSLLDKIYAVSY